MMQELIDRLAALAPTDGIHPTAWPGLVAIRQNEPTAPLHSLYMPTVCILAQGAKLVMVGEQACRYQAGEHLVVSVDLPISGHIVEASPAEPYLCFALDLDVAAFAGLLLEHGAAEAPRGKPAPALYVERTPAALADAAVRLLRLLDQPDDLAALAPLVVREIHYRLLRGAHGAAVRHIAAPEGKTHQVMRAIAWLKAHYAEPFELATVAAEARMSTSALHEAFKAVTALSPLQYQKQLRLQEARRLMLGHALDAAEAGFQVGYDSPSQFTREYARLFGAPPRRDVMRLRGAAARAAG